MIIRKAAAGDIGTVEEIYNRLHTLEEAGMPGEMSAKRKLII